LHELAHWRRGDHWVRGSKTVVLYIYWWGPWSGAKAQCTGEEELMRRMGGRTVPESVRAYALAVETVRFSLRSSRGSSRPALRIWRSDSVHFLSAGRLTMMFQNPMPRVADGPGPCVLFSCAAVCCQWVRRPASGSRQGLAERGAPAVAAPDVDPDEAPPTRRVEGKESEGTAEKTCKGEVERLEKREIDDDAQRAKAAHARREPRTRTEASRQSGQWPGRRKRR